MSAKHFICSKSNILLTIALYFRQIKMSSPNLNNLIIVGCLLCYSSVIILGLDSSLTSEPAFRYICTVKAWVLMAGFTLSFGSMFSKTWRVHSIFTNVQLNKKVGQFQNETSRLGWLWTGNRISFLNLKRLRKLKILLFLYRLMNLKWHIGYC